MTTFSEEGAAGLGQIKTSAPEVRVVAEEMKMVNIGKNCSPITVAEDANKSREMREI